MFPTPVPEPAHNHCKKQRHLEPKYLLIRHLKTSSTNVTV